MHNNNQAVTANSETLKSFLNITGTLLTERDYRMTQTKKDRAFPGSDLFSRTKIIECEVNCAIIAKSNPFF